MKHYEVQELVRLSSLTATERAVVLELSYKASGDEGVCYESQETIAACTGLGERTVRRDLASLVRRGVLEVVPDRSRRSTTYRIRVAAIPARTAGEAAPHAGYPVQSAEDPAPPAQVNPAPHAGYPAQTDPDTGTTCQGTRHHMPGYPAPRATDPIHDPIHDPSLDPESNGRARATPPAPLSQGLTAEQIAARERLLRQQEADTGKPASRRDSLVLTHLLSTGTTPERLDWLWEWSGVSEDPSVAGCRAGGWRVWSSLVKGERGEERLRAAADWVSAGRPTGSDGPPGRSAARGQSTSGDGALARVAKKFAASNTVIEEVTLGEG